MFQDGIWEAEILEITLGIIGSEEALKGADIGVRLSEAVSLL